MLGLIIKQAKTCKHNYNIIATHTHRIESTNIRAYTHPSNYIFGMRRTSNQPNGIASENRKSLLNMEDLQSV
jgi:hypothetical protein